MSTGDPHNFGGGDCWCGENHLMKVYTDAYQEGYNAAREVHNENCSREHVHAVAICPDCRKLVDDNLRAEW